MATDRMTLLEQVGKAAHNGDVDFLRQAVKTMAEALMELEVAAKLGADPHERTAERTGYRNGRRRRDWDTRAGTIELEIPRVRRGSYFPDWLLEPRRRSERALYAVVAEAYVLGVSTRKVDALVRTLGIDGISKSEVSRLCSELDRSVRAFRERRLDEHRYPYVWLDAKVEKVREGGRILQMAILVAIAVNERGEREILGCEVGTGETGAVWTGFLRSLVARGLHGVRLVISDNHAGLVKAIDEQLLGAAWQRSSVPDPHHARRPRARAQDGAGHGRGVCPDDLGPARRRLGARAAGRIAEHLASSFPKAAQTLLAAEEDVLAYTAMPPLSTGARSGPPTRSNGSTVSSPSATTWSGSSPTATRSSASTAHCSPSSTTSG